MCGCAMDGGVWSWVMGPLGLVMMLGFWTLLIWGGISLARHLTGGGGGAAERLLSRRLAAGEIGEEEYRQRLDAIRSGATEREPWPWGMGR